MIIMKNKPNIQTYILSFIFCLLPFVINAQEAFVHVSNSEIYEFIDELAAEQIFEINDLVKPYARITISNFLKIADQSRDKLNSRQVKELDFYLKDYNKELKKNKKDFKKRIDLFFYKDSLFTISVNPIAGIQYFSNKTNTVFHRWNGAEAFSYIGNWSFYASLRDNHESNKLYLEEYAMQRQGGNYKTVNEGGDYSEMRGGITYQWKWGSIGIIKDNPKWGYGYNGSVILSGQTPSYAHVYFNANPVKWFKFNYQHGWLVSEVLDSAASFTYTNTYGTGRRDVLQNKYIAANMFTFSPWANTDISFGNSVIYSLENIHPAYFIPLMFYKSIDHTLNSTDQSGTNVGQNSQMFFALSVRELKHVHLYTSFFLDEIHISNITDPEKHSNFYSLKSGVRISNWPFQNIAANVEYTRTNPLTFQHNIPVTTFESNGYNLGHYLKDNAQEIYLSIAVRPIRGMIAQLSYTHAKKGPDYTELGSYRLGLPFMETVEWENKTLKLDLKYQVINDGFVFLSFAKSSITGDKVDVYTPAYLVGDNFTTSFGLNFGF